MVKVVLIEDSSFMRIRMSDILADFEGVELVGVAKDGREGVDIAIKKMPDVVLTDMVMPQEDGVYVVKNLMRSNPVPVVILSSLNRTNPKVFDALKAGAVDFIEKNLDADQDRDFENELRLKLFSASQANLKPLFKEVRKGNSELHAFQSTIRYDIITIGASTGGPGAIETILGNLPRNLNLPIIVAQHMPARFIESFASRLMRSTGFRVEVARRGGLIENGIVYFMPGDKNLKVTRGMNAGEYRFAVSRKQFLEYNNPSVDCLMESVAEAYGSRVIGVILTGMGRDGAMGLKKIKEAGGYTVVQDEKSAVVFGMPRAAEEIGAANKIVNLRDMAPFIVSCCDI